MKKLNITGLLAFCACAAQTALGAVTLVQTSDPGYYNNTIGTALNLTNGGYFGMFPTEDDAPYTYPTAPDLSTASGALGNWLTNPLSLNGNWQSPAPIPNSWTVGTEVAVIYQFNTLGATNVVASFGVDNGIFVWLDGVYIGGARQGGATFPGEHVFNIGNLNAGTHFLQLLLEDHGQTNGYHVSITADTFVPGPPPGPPPGAVPDSGGFMLYALALGLLAAVRRFVAR